MRNKGIYFILILLVANACIKPYDPKLNDNAINKYVVQGLVSSVEGWQEVAVSRTSSIDKAEFFPISGCDLSIIDDQGNTFELEQFDDGKYRVFMYSSELVTGRGYMVKILMPNGDILESEYDVMPEGPSEMGDVYFQIEEQLTDDPEFAFNGIQFYTDFSASEDDGKYYRWKCTETYEYHSEYPLEFYYDQTGVHQVSPPDYSKMICYKTNIIEDVYTLSTLNLASNSFDAYKLNYVKNSSNRLDILYSLLVEQASISEEAFNYYDKLRINVEQSGGLYTSQPLAIKGNFTNTTNPDNEVLGYFQASTVASTRVFIEPLDDLELDFLSACILNPLRFGFIEIPRSEYPAYLFSSGGDWTLTTMTKTCVDCTQSGGVIEKPDYWPN